MNVYEAKNILSTVRCKKCGLIPKISKIRIMASYYFFLDCKNKCNKTIEGDNLIDIVSEWSVINR